MKSDKQQKTIKYYNNQAAEWARSYGRNEGESYWKPQMERFHELLPSGKLLEVGSGGGRDASFLIALGYEYTGTDASKGLIEVAMQKIPTGTFINVSVDELDFPEKSFDGFWAVAVLLHIPKVSIDRSLQSIKRVVRKGGIGFITLKKGEGEGEDEKTGRWFSYYKEDEFREVLKRNGFDVVEFSSKPDGRADRPDWLMFHVQVLD